MFKRNRIPVVKNADKVFIQNRTDWLYGTIWDKSGGIFNSASLPATLLDLEKRVRDLELELDNLKSEK